MEKVELLLPAGNVECLRAAVNNGADAVYLGLNRFNARQSADNFTEKNIFSVVKYCHDRNVKVYVTLNTLVKDSELDSYFSLVNLAASAKVDAVIIQDVAFVPIIKKEFPDLKIHLSTQATVTNKKSIPDVDRVILARELDLDSIKGISEDYETEIFVHGALCFSYSGQCLFSSMAGGRSGNRGMCAQPCRRVYNNKYLMSTMDLCMLSKIPSLIETGVKSFKIEGRLRSPLYVATAAKIYRKVIDAHYRGEFSFSDEDIDNLKIAFNREFTTGFAFNESITDSRKPMNRGLFLGLLKDGRIELKKKLIKGDGVGIWKDDEVTGYTVNTIIHKGKSVNKAFPGDIIELEGEGPVYKTSSAESSYELGDELEEVSGRVEFKKVKFDFKDKEIDSDFKIFVKCYTMKNALLADKAKADVIYYDLMKDDVLEVKKSLKNSKFFVFTPRILNDKELEEVKAKIDLVKPDGVLVGNRGLLDIDYEKHLDYSFNVFNSVDLDYYDGVPIISPELNFKEISSLYSNNFIALVHGDTVLMNTKEKLKAPELVDEEERRFKVREGYNVQEILNSKQIGLFNKVKNYLNIGVKYYFIDVNKDVDKFIRIYRKILSKEAFDDSKIRKGYTTGHFERGIL